MRWIARSILLIAFVLGGLPSCSFKKGDPSQHSILNDSANGSQSHRSNRSLLSTFESNDSTSIISALNDLSTEQIESITVDGQTVIDFFVNKGKLKELSYVLARGINPDNCNDSTFKKIYSSDELWNIFSPFWVKAYQNVMVHPENYDQLNMNSISCQRMVRSFFMGRYSGEFTYRFTQLNFSIHDIRTILHSKTCKNNYSFEEGELAGWYAREVMMLVEEKFFFNSIFSDPLSTLPYFDFLTELGPIQSPTLIVTTPKGTTTINPAVLIFGASVSDEQWNENKEVLWKIISPYLLSNKSAYKYDITNKGCDHRSRSLNGYCAEKSIINGACETLGIACGEMQSGAL